MSDSAPSSHQHRPAVTTTPNRQPPEARLKPTTQLHRGDIIGFTISASATTAEYDKPLVRESLQRSYPTYLGVVKSSIITQSPSVVEGYASASAPQKVELLDIAYIGSTPPDNNMIQTQGLIKFLPGQSLAYACIPINQADPLPQPIDPRSKPRPPLQVVGGGVLPPQLGFVHTSFAFSAHLGELHPGETSLKLAEGEPYRLAICASSDTTAIGDARARLWNILRSHPDDGDDDASDESEPTSHVFHNVVIDVWTDLRNIGPVGEPIDLQAEILGVERAINRCYQEEPLPVGDWAQAVQKEAPPARKSFSPGIVFAAGATLFGSVFAGLINKLRR